MVRFQPIFDTSTEGPTYVAVSKSIDRFLELAERGQFPAASGGEARCFELAKLLRQAIEHAPGTDRDAVEGFCLLALRSLDNYQEVREVLEANVPKAEASEDE